MPSRRCTSGGSTWWWLVCLPLLVGWTGPDQQGLPPAAESGFQRLELLDRYLRKGFKSDDAAPAADA